VGAGATSGGTMDASNLLKPALAAGRLRCIGSTTYEEYKSHLREGPRPGAALPEDRRGRALVEETVQILEGLKPRYEEHHGVTYTDEALRGRRRAVGEAHQRPLPAGQGHRRASTRPARRTVCAWRPSGPAPWASPTSSAIGGGDGEDPRAQRLGLRPRPASELEADLKAVVFGQDAAIEQGRARHQARPRGPGPPEKPIGSFLFAGPTGVGKTELAKQLAGVLGNHFARFDMSEYMEKHAVSRLIGAPPGYVGFDQGGLLTDAVAKHPYTVLLLDEIEKAHPDSSTSCCR
jgi:ATP-dependent Clp protease ATP-binding subunit ClpA